MAGGNIPDSRAARRVVNAVVTVMAAARRDADVMGATVVMHVTVAIAIGVSKAAGIRSVVRGIGMSVHVLRSLQ